MATQPIPTTILSGFLGSGKTTLLNNLLNGNHGRRIAVLVNDFGEINIDAQLIVGVEGETVSLKNGCICCSIRDDLLTEMIRVCQTEPVPEHIIIEASGVSDPIAIANTLMSAQMAGHVVLDAIITVVDAEQVKSLSGPDQVLSIDQIGVADIVVLNKVDLVDAATKADVRDEFIRSIVPDARIIETTHGVVPVEALIGIGVFDPTRLLERDAREVHVHGPSTDHHHHAHDHTLIFDNWNWFSNEPVSFKKLKKAVDKIPTAIYRAKGVFYVADDPARRAVLQVVGRRVWLEMGAAWDGTAPYSNFIVIGQQGGFAADDMQALMDGTLASAEGDSSPLERVGKALSWLRGR